MKRLLALILTVVLIASLASCSVSFSTGGNNDNNNNNNNAPASSNAASSTPPATQAATEAYPVTGNIVYFDDTLFWSNGGKNIYIDYWSSSNYNMVEWPGKPMKSLGNGIFSYELPDGVEYIIFNNNLDKETQTRDIIYNGSVRFFKAAIETDKVGAHYVKDWNDNELKTNDVDGGKGY